MVILVATSADPELKDKWAASCATLGQPECDYTCGIVMPAAQRNLMVVLLQEFLPLNASMRMIKALAGALKHLHDCGKLHGDFKPLNAVRMADGRW